LCVATPAYMAWRVLREFPKDKLWSKEELLLRLGPLYNTFYPRAVVFVVPVMIYKLVSMSTTGAAYAAGWVQISVLVIAEVAYLVVFVVMWPNSDKRRYVV